MAVTTKWICPSCSCHNHPSMSLCSVCNFAKPTDLYHSPRLSPGGPRLKHFQLGAGGTSRGSLSSGLSGQYSASGAGISSDMIIDSENVFGRYRPSSMPLGKQREGVAGRGREEQQQQSSVSSGHQSKWICSACTYSNWPNSKHCTMCDSLRGRHKPSPQSGVGGYESGRGGAGISIGESILDYAPSLGAVGGGGGSGGGQDDIRLPFSSQYTRDLPSNRPAKSKMGKKSSAENRVQKKWKCVKCTYENWARASKCIMCQTAKNKTPSPPMSDSEGSQSPNSASKNLYSQHHPSLSPTENANTAPSSSSMHVRSLGINSNQSAASPTHTEITPSAVHLIPCTASDDSAQVYPSTQLKSTSNEARQIRNRLSSSDWLFINACLGVVNEDVQSVKAYIRNEGDRARQLTRDECLVLGQPSVFSVGSTLVHLAIR